MSHSLVHILLLLGLCSFLSKGLLPVGVVPNHQGAGGIGTQPPPPGDGELPGELEPAGPLDRLEGHLEVGNGLRVGDGGVGEDKGAQGDVATYFSILGEDNFVKVGGHGDRGRVTDHLVLGVPFAVGRVPLR